MKKVNILGTWYSIEERSEREDERLKGCDGYCDWTTKLIVIEREISGNLGDMGCYIRKILRHEIVHAFILESGLHECSGETEAWACNEVMVDWFARQGPKIYAAWEEAGAVVHQPVLFAQNPNICLGTEELRNMNNRDLERLAHGLPEGVV